MAYIKLDKDLLDDPRVADLAERLARLEGTSVALACNAVLGGLYRLWRYADTHLGRHNRLKTPLHGPARISEVTALPVALLEQFPPEWLKVHDDGSVELPDYAAKNNLIDKDIRRAKIRERVRRFRENKRAASGVGNAQTSVTAPALQRYQNVTTGPDRTGPVPDHQTGTGTVPAGAPADGPDGAASAPKSADEILEQMQAEQRARFGVAVPLPTEKPPHNGQALQPEAVPGPWIPPAERVAAARKAMRAAVPAPTPEELQARARKLALLGQDPPAIASVLRQYGVTASQVEAWVA